MTPRATKPIPVIALFTGVAFAVPGCVERTITITSEPDGVLVYLNDREVGRTPVDVEFVHYGTYDVRMVKKGFEPLLTAADAEPPIWDLPGPDFFAEITPARFRSDIRWHFVMEPIEAVAALLVDRARETRMRLAEAETDAVSEADAAAASEPADAEPTNAPR